MSQILQKCAFQSKSIKHDDLILQINNLSGTKSKNLIIFLEQ